MSVQSETGSVPDTTFTLENPDVVTKYRAAADISNKALQLVIDASKDGADIYDLCKLGDDLIIEETGKLYNKKVKKDDKDEGKKMDKGIGFPTCIAVNEVAGHFSPLKAESRLLRSGDLVKIDLGTQIDGFIAQAAHTIVIPPGAGDSPSRAANENGKVADRRADVVTAAYTAMQAALRIMQVGNKNTEITQAFQKVADEFKCQPVSGVLSHQLNRHVIDGEKCIISKENVNEDQKTDEFEFATNEAYTLDVYMSTGDGKTREMECRHTVYKRAAENSYLLKTAKARQFIGEVNKRFPSLPFSLRNIDDEQCARVGVSEAKRHNLLHEYPVLAERPGEMIAQFKCTVLLLPGGTKQISGLTFSQGDLIESTYKVEDEALKTLLAKSIAPRKKKNKAKKDGEAKEE